MFWLFGCEACGTLAPQSGIEPTRPAPPLELEGEVLATGPPGESINGFRSEALPGCGPSAQSFECQSLVTTQLVLRQVGHLSQPLSESGPSHSTPPKDPKDWGRWVFKHFAAPS